MKSKILLPWSLFAISLAGIVWPALIIFSLVFTSPVQGSYAKSGSAVSVSVPKKRTPFKSAKIMAKVLPKVQVNLGVPIRLKIPKIKVDTIIEPVGLTADGAVGVPKGPVNAGWFDLGPRPGDMGSAVIVGHYGRWKNGVATVFNNLAKLEVGDKIYIADKKGLSTVFIVREFKIYSPDEETLGVFDSSDGQAHLNLITCGGVWSQAAKSYDQRLVVFTDQE